MEDVGKTKCKAWQLLQGLTDSVKMPKQTRSLQFFITGNVQEFYVVCGYNQCLALTGFDGCCWFNMMKRCEKCNGQVFFIGSWTGNLENAQAR